jgi:predicted MFS family arabinose efflux permease
MVFHHEGAGFLGGRLLHGIASACVFVSAQALALHAGGDSARGGSNAAAVRVAIVLGIPIGFVAGGILSDAFGDTMTFAIAGGASIAALLGAAVSVPDLRVGVARARTVATTLRSLRDRRLLAVGSLSFAVSFAAGGMILTTLPLVIDVRHLSLFGRSARGTSGLLMGMLSVVDVSFTRFFGRLGDKFAAHARVAVVSIGLVAIGLAILAVEPTMFGMVTGLALVAVGVAGLGPSALVLVSLVVPPEDRGAGVGVTQLCSDFGGMLGPLVGTALFAGDESRPYLFTAILVACFIPVALTLVPLEKRAREGSKG